MSDVETRLSERKAAVCAAIDRRRPELEALSLRIHANPELGFEERQAAQWLTEALESDSFEVRRGVAGLETAFLGSYRGGDGPTVAVLAEYDALPGIGHACGHNLIGTSAVGAALGLKEGCPDLPGAVMVVGAPAEETAGGKVNLVEAGVFDQISAAMMVHPSVRTRVIASMISMQEVVVRYYGKSAHASSRPFDGVNALDALVLAYVNVAALRQHIRPDARIHGIITDGGRAPNIVPDYAAGHFYIRARDDAYLDELRERVLGCFRAGAEATGARLEYAFQGNRYAAMRNNPTLVELFRANLRLLGIEETAPDPNRSSGSSDMGNVSAAVPAVHPHLAIAPVSVLGHSPAFAECSASPAGLEGMVQAAKAMAMTVLDLLVRPELMARAREEFVAGRLAQD